MTDNTEKQPKKSLVKSGLLLSLMTFASRIMGLIREILAGLNLPADLFLLYGGSAKPENAASLLSQENIDGLFIGRSAWQADAFHQIIRDVIPVWEQK